MRDTKFRGKRIDSNKWVYGYYVAFSMPQDYPRFKVEHRIYTHLNEADCSVSFKVIPETVGQFTGLKSKSGIEVYEGDDVDVSMSFEGGTLPHRGIIVYDNEFGAFGTKNDAGVTLLHNHCLHTLEVIGDIHENKDLLNEK